MTAVMSLINPPQVDPMHIKMANAIRFLSMDAVQKAKSGHPGMPMGMADVATVLFRNFLKFDPKNPKWPDRDRFILSAGHGSMLLYSLLHLTGYEDMTLEELKNFRQLGSKTAGHPEYGHAAGIETTTGPLGQGIANSVGFALAERMLEARYGDLVDHYTYVIAGDGDLMEGLSHEAASMAGHLKLSKLIVFFDDNSISIDGATDLSVSDDQIKRFESYGWATQAIDGHDPAAISAAIELAQTQDQPSLIACKTTIGYGAPTKAGTASTHGAPLGDEEIAATREALDWPHAPFELPEDVLSSWRDIGAKGEIASGEWQTKLDAQTVETRESFLREQVGELPGNWDKGLAELKQSFMTDKPEKATRQLSQAVLEVVAPNMPNLIGGSADLTGSNNTKAACQDPVSAGDYSGAYIHYGVREHGMAAAMNGLSLHGGFVPYGGTFLIFSDYLRPSLRLAALMKQRAIHVLTHDSIGLGEDGPTHQPIEHLAALRAIPNLNVFRPADAMEVAECWQIALESKETPSVLALTRQKVGFHRQDDTGENLSAKGGYVVLEPSGGRDVTLIATGSGVSLVMNAARMLAEEGVKAAVVSLPCWELFDLQSTEYREQTLGSAPRLAAEAGIVQGWEKYIGPNGTFMGLSDFGASAPYLDLYEHFGLTPKHVVARVKEIL